MLIENIQRDDLSEVEKAAKIHEMMSGDPTLSAREIAKKLGIDEN
jgi:cation transport ATPase